MSTHHFHHSFWTVSCAAVLAALFGGCRAESRDAAEEVGTTSAPAERLVTLQGCVTQTSDPRIFILAVPGEVARTVRGIGEGEAVPPGSEAGPRPAKPPTSVPPADGGERPPLEPEGRVATPTIRNLTYRLEGSGAGDLSAMVGKTVEVTGMLPTEGYPSGDPPRDGADTEPTDTTMPIPLETRSVRFVSEGCPGRR